jgi:RNA polymerase sigma factor (sigma-70 family)
MNITDNSQRMCREAKDEWTSLLLDVIEGREACSQLINHSAFNAMLNRICRFVYRKLPTPCNEFGVDDLKQELCLHLIKHSERLNQIPLDASSFAKFLAAVARNLLLENVHRAEEARKHKAGSGRGPWKELQYIPAYKTDSPLAPVELRGAAISELETLSALLDSDPDLIDAMSIVDVLRELREMGADVDKPLFEATDPATRNVKKQSTVYLLEWTGRTAPRASAWDELMPTYARSFRDGRIADSNGQQILENEERAKSTVVRDEEREHHYRAPAGWSPYSRPSPEAEALVDTLEEEIQRDLADPAFQMLVTDPQFQQMLDKICKRLLTSEVSGYSWEDLKQDVLIKFGRWVWPHRYDVSFKRVLYQIAHNQLIDTHRSLNKQCLSLEELLPEDDGALADLAAARALSDIQDRLQVREWLEVLKGPERNLFVCHFVEGKSLNEIARERSVSRRAVCEQWRRILSKLKPLVEDV